MEYEVVSNYFNEPVKVLVESSYDDLHDIVMEARATEEDLHDGEFHVCTFKKLEQHQTRPGLVVIVPNHKPLVMVIGTTKYSEKWKQYKDNVLVHDWKIAHLRDESYASTNALFGLEDVIVNKKVTGKITRGDYDKIIAPVKKRILDDETEKLFEATNSISPDGIFEIIKEDLDSL